LVVYVIPCNKLGARCLNKYRGYQTFLLPIILYSKSGVNMGNGIKSFFLLCVFDLISVSASGYYFPVKMSNCTYFNLNL